MSKVKKEEQLVCHSLLTFGSNNKCNIIKKNKVSVCINLGNVLPPKERHRAITRVSLERHHIKVWIQADITIVGKITHPPPAPPLPPVKVPQGNV